MKGYVAKKGNRWYAVIYEGTVALAGGAEADEAAQMRRRRSSPQCVSVSSAFAGYRFPPDVILLAVRWYLRYGLSYRDVEAVVSRGGRPDLAGPRLAAVTAPTLLIVGGADVAVLDLNRQAQAHLRCESHLAIVPGATHLFEEPGTLQAAAELARDWFTTQLACASRNRSPGATR